MLVEQSLGGLPRILDGDSNGSAITDLGAHEFDPDFDDDGFPASVDCDDMDANISPIAPEFCNGIDDDCDGVADDGFPNLDGDLAADCVDCALTINSVQSPPGPVGDTLRIAAGSPALLSWQKIPQAHVYNIYRAIVY